MSLQTRLDSLITAVGADIKSLKSQVELPRQPSELGLLADPGYDPTSTIAPTAGTLYLVKIKVPVTMSFANAAIIISTAGTGATALANCFIGIYKFTAADVLTLIGKTANQALAWATTGYKTAALTAEAGQSLTVPGAPGVYVYAAVLVGTQSTTQVQMARAANTLLAGFNASLAPAAYRIATNGTGLSSLPSTRTPSSNVGGNPPWVGLL